ncbi:MAG: phosphatase PAP2 family protein [Clostridia bacterium]|nr:phosphatase PAP2 family protein [Clostridia bacterium]
MNADLYLRLVEKTRQITRHLPSARLLSLPTYLCATVYLLFGLSLFIHRDPRLLPYLLIPLICFLTVTVLRKCINRTRPYDRYSYVPIGRYTPNKGKSMPSRHAASAVAILMALLRLSLPVPLSLCLCLLTLLICFLRVASGQHYPEDVLAGIGLSVSLSLLLSFLFSSFSH